MFPTTGTDLQCHGYRREFGAKTEPKVAGDSCMFLDLSDFLIQLLNIYESTCKQFEVKNNPCSAKRRRNRGIS